MKLPKQLQDRSFRFIKIKNIPLGKPPKECKRRKHPLENDWQMTNNYKYNDPDFVEYLKTADGYGVACGFGKLAIIDCDNQDSAKFIVAALPKTFTVLTPGHGTPHLYYIIKDLTEKIVIMDDMDVHHGEAQFTGAQALGPGSLHPNGELYKVFKDAPITRITKQQLMDAIKPFLKKKKKIKPCNSGKKLDISNVLPFIKGLDESGGELMGIHPVHGSEGGANFRINVEKNVWHCFRHGTGGDALTLVAVLEEIVPCKECKSGYFKDHPEEFKRTIKAAEEKYGYVDATVAEQKKMAELARPLSELEIAKLKDPKLLLNIIQEIHKEGVVGEEAAMLVLINRVAMRCVENITKTSGNIIVSDNTGLGKDNLTEKLCRVMLTPDRTLFSATCISDKALNYWHPGNEGASWDGRVMYLQDPEEDTLKGQAFRVRASGDNKNVTLDTDRKLQQIEIVGKPILIVTSMKAGVDIELMRRWDAVKLDNSDELTAAIMTYQLKMSEGNTVVAVDETLRDAVRNLPRIRVSVPYATKLTTLLPMNNTSMRTQTLKFLDTIKASAALHQFQRGRNGKGEVLADKDDLMYAVFIINWCDILAGQMLNRKQEELLDYLKRAGEAVSFKKIIADNPGMSESWIYRQEKDLVERRLIQMTREYDTETSRDIKCFKIDLTFNIRVKVPKIKAGYFSDGLEPAINEIRKEHKLTPIKLN